MRPTTAHDDKNFDFDSLLHPGTTFEHPRDVVSRRGLSLSEKRAILASWASDAPAIASCPSLPAPDGRTGVPVVRRRRVQPSRKSPEDHAVPRLHAERGGRRLTHRQSLIVRKPSSGDKHVRPKRPSKSTCGYRHRA